MMLRDLHEPGKQALDYSLAGAGIAFGLKLLPVLTGLAALILILLRIIVGVQEYRINRRKLGE